MKDRIKELRRVKASELNANPKNWRAHPQEQLEALEAVVDKVGFAGAVLARELGDGSLQLIDGHARAKLADGAEVPVLVLDVTEDEADLILATYDPLSAMATEQSGELDNLMSELAAQGDEVAAMLASIHSDFTTEDLAETLGDYEPETAPPQKVLVLKYSPADYDKVTEALDRHEQTPEFVVYNLLVK